MRILYLAQRVPYPPDRGDKIITFHQVRHLARNHHVTVACLSADEEDLENAEKLTSLVPRVHAVRLDSFRAKVRALKGLVVGRPLTTGYFNESKLRRWVDQLLGSGTIDAAVVFSSGMAQFVEHATHLPRIIHFADLDSLKWKQYADAARIPRRWLYAAEARRLMQYERHIARTFDHSLVCTTGELEDFRRLIQPGNVSCVPNGVDLDYFQPVHAAKRSNSLVFTGVMDYTPNANGVAWFCREVLPLIRRRIPDVTFTICGARPGRTVNELAGIPGVTVTGRVPDVRPYLAEACVAVVPLLISRGIQNKVLEAMAMGLPVVTTSSAFEGVDANSGSDLIVANEPMDFARNVVKLLEDGRFRAEIGRRARARIEEKYQWSASLSKLDSVLAMVTAQRRSRADSDWNRQESHTVVNDRFPR